MSACPRDGATRTVVRRQPEAVTWRCAYGHEGAERLDERGDDE